MSLHGDIRINGQKIADWEARRLTPLDEQPGRYDCKVTRYGGTEARPMYRYERFELTHRYADGADALAVAVLSHRRTDHHEGEETP